MESSPFNHSVQRKADTVNRYDEQKADPVNQYEKWKGTILLSDKSVGLNGIRKKTTKVTNVAAVLREIKVRAC